MEIIVGRQGNQPFKITDQEVSSRHLKITTIPDSDNVIVEDLNSTNGTFIGNVRISKKTVPQDTVVRMGTTYTFTISSVLDPSINQASDNQQNVGIGNALSNSPQQDQSVSIDHLEAIWEDYSKEKINLQRSNAAKGFLRILPMLILGLIGYLVSCIPEWAEYRLLLTSIGIGIGVMVTIISYYSTTDLPEKLEKLNQQFQIDYVCPNCKQFLGFTPFVGVKNKGKCTGCKSKWA